MPQTFNKKTVYHSELASKGVLTIMLTQPPRASKYAGKPAYAKLRIQGDDTDYTLTVENEMVDEALCALPLNAFVTVHAQGARETARLVVKDAPAPRQPPPVRREAPAERNRPVADREARQQRPATTDVPTANAMDLAMWNALTAGHRIVAAFVKYHGREPSEAERCIAASLFIESNRNPTRPVSYNANARDVGDRMRH
jgi:hypothetical protein